MSNSKDKISKLVTNKDEILVASSDVFDGIGCFPGPKYHIQVDASVTPKQTPWINCFVLVESKDRLENLKLRICLDPTNLNKVIVHEPYYFKTPEDIAHHLE